MSFDKSSNLVIARCGFGRVFRKNESTALYDMVGKSDVSFGINIRMGRRQNGNHLFAAGKTLLMGGSIAVCGKSTDDSISAFS